MLMGLPSSFLLPWLAQRFDARYTLLGQTRLLAHGVRSRAREIYEVAAAERLAQSGTCPAMAKSGIKIEFTAEGARVVWGQRVSGFQATVQDALVNMATAEGSARTHPERGTGLWASLNGGGMLDTASSQHAGNFAALDTVFFLRRHDDPDDPDDLCR